MKILSNFSSSLNEKFGCTIAIPKGQDFGYLTKIFGEERDKILEDFKNSSVHNGSNRITAVSAISFPTDYYVNGERLYLIDYSMGQNKDDVAEIVSEPNLPRAYFSRTEYESFALLHELGHCLDSGCKYYDLEDDSFDTLRWQKECFADFFATIMLEGKVQAKGFSEERLIPFRSLSATREYQTSPAIKFAQGIAKHYDSTTMSEKEFVRIAIKEWNSLDSAVFMRWKNEIELNMFNLRVLRGCKVSGGLDEFLSNFDQTYHAGITQNITAFIDKLGPSLMENATQFGKQNDTATKLQLCLFKPLQKHISLKHKGATFDGQIGKYLKNFPDCPLAQNSRACHKAELAI